MVAKSFDWLFKATEGGLSGVKQTRKSSEHYAYF